MSRFNAKALFGAATVFALAGTSFGQLTVTQPVIDNREFVGDDTKVLFAAAGVNTETITAVTAQVFVVRDDGVAVAVSAARPLPATSIYDSAAADFSMDGAFFAFNASPDDLIVDMDRALNATPALRTDLDNATASLGMMDGFGNTNVTIYIQFSVTTDGPTTLTTANPGADNPPEAATAANGGIEAGVSMVTSDATDVSPQYIPPPVLSEVTISDPSTTPIANYIFNRVLNNGAAANNLNQLVLANIDEDDIAVNGGAPSMATTAEAFGPSNDVLRITFPMGVISSGNTLGFRSDIGAMNTQPDARDFVGYSLVPLSDVASNAVELAVVGASFTSGSAVGGNTGVLQVEFNQALSNPGSADAYDLQLNGTALRATNQIVLGAPAIDADDSSRVNIAIDFDGLGTDDVGIAPNGRALDGNILVDFDMVGVINHTQFPFFVEVRDDGTTDPADALGNNLDLMGTPFVDTNAVQDAIEPGFEFAATLDTNNDGLIDAVALVFNETVSMPSANGVTIEALDGSMVTDISMIEEFTGALPAAAAVDLTGNQTLAGTFTSTIGTIELTAGTDNPSFQNNNAVIFGSLDNSVFTSAMEPIPSTGDTSNYRITYNGTTGTIADASGNDYDPGVADMQVVDTDRAAPALLRAYYFTGDNQGANNDQLAVEQDGVVGDQADNDRVAMAFSEDLADNTPDETFVTVNGTTFDTSNNNGGRLAGATMDNVLTLVNDEEVDFGPGDEIALGGGVDISDAAGNIAQGSAMAMNGVAPYIPLQDDMGTIDSAFLVDDDNDGFADRVFLQFTEDIVQANLASDGSDFQSFGANSGTITGADTLTGGNNSIVVLSLVDGEVSMNSDADFRYLGSTAANLIEGAATGNAVAATDVAFVAQQINDPLNNTNGPDVMLIQGTLTGLDGVTPAPIGTRLYATVAVPTANTIDAEHNNVAFRFSTYDDREYSSDDSLDAFTNVLLGLRRFVYLSRDDENVQIFKNNKELESSDDDGAGFLTDVIDVSLNTRNLSNISFSGRGETRDDQVSGNIGLAWRLPRGSSTAGGLYRNGFNGNSNTVLLSETVISEAGGRYELAVSGLGQRFTGGPLAGLELPVIVWCQLPTGERYALTSLYTSASTNDFDNDGVVGDGIIFSPNVFRQNNNGSAAGATTVNFSLANVTIKQIFANDWTMLPFSSASGFAANSRDIPTLPAGVSESNIVTGSILAASPMEQFVFWNDNDFDGVWDADDGGIAADIFVDFDTVDHMRFNLTTNGVQMGSGMNQAIGGYGIGVLNITNNNYGVFQFGAPLASGPVFSSNPITGAARNRTQGWLLVSTSAESMPATNFFTTNPGSDYVIFFNNRGNDGISVQSVSVTPGDGNPNDLDEIPACSAPFVHYIN